ncbi:hypothetical protein E8E12_009677 [Didymella heteroderae]|uniref:Uncharacterized protein n=1 Tax=Didymella heteroderae TaxID=1769908 RepID=A0A9P4WWY3_9PLEO|nr:hypothetical protein E8E12_009677 [Didymella heteroderae]
MSFFDEMDLDLPTTVRFDDPVAIPLPEEQAADVATTRDTSAETEAVVRTRSAREKYVDVAEIPAAFKLQEGKQIAYDPYVKSIDCSGDVNLVHGQYRKSDNESFKELKVRAAEPAGVIFRDILEASKVPVSMGHLPESSPTEEDKKLICVRVSYLTSTQFTGLRLHVARPGKKDVSYRIFGKSIKMMEKDGKKIVAAQTVSFGASTEEDKQMISKALYGHRVLTPLADNEDLLATQCALGSRGSFVGISDAEIDKLVAKYGDVEQQKQMKPHELLIVRLHKTRAMIIARRVTPVGKKLNKDKPLNAKPFVDYFSAAMWLNVRHGALWFYRLQASTGTSLMDRGFPLDKNDAEEMVSCRPWEWVSLPQVLEYPDADSLAFLASLGVVREAEHKRAVIKQMVDSRDGEMEALFRPVKGRPGHYLVDVSVSPHVKNENAWKDLKPAVETTLTVKILDEDFMHTFKGQVVDDFFGNTEVQLQCFYTAIWVF